MASATRRAGIAPVLLAVVGGLAVSGATIGSWVTVTVRREVAGAELSEELTTAGAEFAPLGVGLGVAAVLAGIALAPARGRARRLLGGLVALTGIAAAFAVGRGAVAAAAEAGGLTGLPGIAGLGAAMVVAAGVLAARRQRPPEALPERFDLDAAEPEGEWRSAVDPREDRD